MGLSIFTEKLEAYSTESATIDPVFSTFSKTISGAYVDSLYNTYYTGSAYNYSVIFVYY